MWFELLECIYTHLDFFSTPLFLLTIPQPHQSVDNEDKDLYDDVLMIFLNNIFSPDYFKNIVYNIRSINFKTC